MQSDPKLKLGLVWDPSACGKKKTFLFCTQLVKHPNNNYTSTKYPNSLLLSYSREDKADGNPILLHLTIFVSNLGVIEWNSDWQV